LPCPVADTIVASMDFSPLGDTAWRIGPFEPPGADPASLARRVRAASIPGVFSVVAAPRTIGVYFDPGESGLSIREAVAALLHDQPVASSCGAAPVVEIPVDYSGEDLAWVAARHGIDPAEVVARHTAPLYKVSAIGFAPGFPYLEGLDPVLHTPRRSTPRKCVPAGSVAIGGHQTGIYPHPSPGGWHVIGRTHLTLFDPFATPPSLLQAGDAVRFVRIEGPGIPESRAAAVGSPQRKTAGAHLEILQAWPGTAVRDGGRHGFLDQGVPPAGPLDRDLWDALQLAAGNDTRAAGIEWVVRGPVMRFGGDCTIATNALPSASGRPTRMAAGTVVDFSQPGAGCLAVSGGLDVPMVLGSATKDPSAGFGGLFGRDLEQGDILPVRAPRRLPPDRPPWSIPRRRAAPEGGIVLRIVPGPDRTGGKEPLWTGLVGREFHVSGACNRMGWRMVESIGAENASMESTPVATGSIQVPPDGCPIILGPDRQTVGGYAQAACVAWVDLPLLADLAPGSTVRFEPISLETAEDLRLDALARGRMLACGLELKFTSA
jgi:KipI family sensor histidine kinase inhibitor